jgi:hypothetical protein
VKEVLINNKEDLQELLQRILDRVQELEKAVALLDHEINSIGEQLFTPGGSLDS